MNQPYQQGQPGTNYRAPAQQPGPPLHQMPPGHPYRPQGQQPPPPQGQQPPPPQGQQPPPPMRSLRDYFREDRPGDAGSYFVLPMTLLHDMPPQWQDRAVALFGEFHQQWQGARWPERYRVEATESRPVSQCDERQLASVGIVADFEDGDDDGDELVYRDPAGETITDPDARRIQVPITDPVLQRTNG